MPLAMETAENIELVAESQSGGFEVLDALAFEKEPIVGVSERSTSQRDIDASTRMCQTLRP